MRRPDASRTVTGNMTSVVSTETTSPGLTSCSGCFLSAGTGGGGPIASSADCGFCGVAGLAVDFGLGVVRCCRSEEHTSELQSQSNLVCRLLLEKKKNKTTSRLSCCACVLLA